MDSREIKYYENIGFATYHTCDVLMQECHRHIEIELNFMLHGCMTYLRADGQYTVTEGQMTLFWGAFPHQVIKMNNDPDLYVIYIPLHQFLLWSLPGGLSSRVLNGEMAVDLDEERSQLDRLLFPSWDRSLKNLSPDNEHTLYLEIEARLRRMANSLNLRKSERADASVNNAYASWTSRESFAKVERMTAFVAAEYSNELTAEQVARESGLHPKYAMALFRKTLGITMLSYINHHRIAHAQRLLATTDAKVTDIAFDSGFGSVSRLYEVFQQVCGKPPSEYRRELRRASH